MLRAFLPGFLLIASATAVPAQQLSSVVPASLSLDGRVVNSQGAGVEGARITIIHKGSRAPQSVTSDPNGKFRVSDLPRGLYNVTVHRNGYLDAMRTAVIRLGEEANLSIVVALAAHQPEAQQAKPRVTDTSAAIGQRSPETPQTTHPTVQSGEGANVQVVLTEPAAIQQFKLLPNSGNAAPVDANGAGMLHGEMDWLLGYGLMPGLNEPGHTILIPLAQYSAAVSVGNEWTSWFASFDQDTFNREYLLAQMLANQSSSSRANEGPLKSSELLTRLDHRFGPRDSFDLRYSRYATNGNPFFPAAQGWNSLEQMLSVHNTVEISPSTLNETQGELVAGHIQVPAETPAYGIQADAATTRRYQIYEAANNLYHQMDRGALRAGGDFAYSRMSVAFLQAGLGNFSDSSRSAGFYVLNQWKVSPNFSLTAGVRYDLQFLRDMQTDANNLAPQLGFAWSPAGSKGMVIRGGYGVMYAQIALPAIAGALQPGGSGINLTRSGSFTNLRDPAQLGSVASFNTLDPAMQNAYTEQASIEVEQPVGGRGAIEASYQNVRGLQLPEPVSRTGSLRAAPSGCNVGNEFPGAGLEYASGGNSSYDAFVVSFVQRPIEWGDYRVTYTKSATQSSGGQEYLAFPIDDMHRASFTGTLHTALDGGSGWWQHVNRGLMLSGYGDVTSRADLPGLDFMNLNTRLTKVLQLGSRTQLEGFAQAADLMEHRTYSLTKAAGELNGYGMSVLSSYERLSALGGSNSTQAGLRLTF